MTARDAGEVARIARGLSKAQREALLWLSDEPKAWPKGGEVSLYCLADWKSGDPEKAMVSHGVFCRQSGRAAPDKKSLWGRNLWVATPLGLAVRAHLENDNEG